MNETLEPASYKASMKMLKGGQTTEDSQQIEVAAGTVAKVFDIDTKGTDAFFLFLKLSDGNDKEVTTNEYFVVTDSDMYDWQKTTWVNTPILAYASYGMLDGLCTKTCELSVKPAADNTYEVTVSNPSDKVAFMIGLKAKDQNGELICPAYWSDNYFSLAPGDSRTVTCKTPALAADTKVSIEME